MPVRSNIVTSAHGQAGFTLLELIISITLVSVIIVILSMSIRTGLRAYVRGHEANREIVAVSGIQGLLGRQLMTAVRPGTGNLAKFFRFKGEEDELVFVTTHAPMGAQAGGIFLVVYRFQGSDNSLIYAQRIVTHIEEIKKELPRHIGIDDISDLRERGWDVSVVQGIHSLGFSYLQKDRDMDVSSLDDWPSAWYRDRQLPAAVGLVLEFENENSRRRRLRSMFFEIPEWKAVKQKTIFNR